MCHILIEIKILSQNSDPGTYEKTKFSQTRHLVSSESPAISVPILKKKKEPLLNIVLMSVELATLVLIKNFISVFQTFQKPSIHQLGEAPFIWSVERFPFL